ncbi:hypothetical protein HAX54_047481 [Datura stramonium]|uniref:Uncharacterized protein n=1 Tax=Datura stramonium TaxID=4076 RepID=A0ABS8WM07_DATST|nr:hypothetical protein [Datura stramonium]
MKSQSSNNIPPPFRCNWMILMILLISITPNKAARILSDNNTENEIDFSKGNEYLLLPSLQWNPVRTPTPNPGTNARTKMTSQVGQRNFAGSKEFASPPPLYNEYPRIKIAFGVVTD